MFDCCNETPPMVCIADFTSWTALRELLSSAQQQSLPGTSNGQQAHVLNLGMLSEWSS